MSEIEKIRKYINSTKIKSKRAGAPSAVVFAIADETDPYNAVILAFMYGRAKVYRAAKAEAKKCH